MTRRTSLIMANAGAAMSSETPSNLCMIILSVSSVIAPEDGEEDAM